MIRRHHTAPAFRTAPPFRTALILAALAAAQIAGVNAYAAAPTARPHIPSATMRISCPQQPCRAHRPDIKLPELAELIAGRVAACQTLSCQY